MKHKILIVDDEPANLRLLERLFRRRYQVISALSGKEALEMLEQHDISVIISDQRMPEMTGIEFLKCAAALRHRTVRIILTGYTDVNALVEAINSGVVYKYVTKPWVNEDLQQTVVRALQHYETNKNRYELKMQNEHLLQSLKETRQGFVRLISDVLNLKDEYAHGHARRTNNYARAIGSRFGLEKDELEELSLAAFLHEAGNLANPNDFCGNCKKLNGQESLLEKNNFERILNILSSVPEISEIAPTIRHQYERFDGTGLPEGLRGEQIPVFSRIISVACAYDRMTSNGLSDQPLTHSEAIERLQADAGKQFCPEVIRFFSDLINLEKIRNAINTRMEAAQSLSLPISFLNFELTGNELVDKVKTEPLLAMEVIKLANTSSPDEPTSQILEAAARVGESELRRLTDEYGLLIWDERTGKLADRALRRSLIAKLLAAHTNIVHPDEAYTLGLLFDVGELLLNYLFTDEINEFGELDKQERLNKIIETFGVDPAQITQWMLETCGMPMHLIKVLHTDDELKRINDPLGLLMLVANQLIDSTIIDNEAASNSISSDVLKALDLNKMDLTAICERVSGFCGKFNSGRQNKFKFSHEFSF